MMSRAERTVLGEWWWTIDRYLLFALGLLMVSGVVFSLAASPPVAERLGLGLFHFVNRQVIFLVPAAFVLLGVSFLNSREVRRLALFIFIGAWLAMVAALFIGPEIKGAHRWLFIGGVNVQPSEFVKPSFVVLAAWLFAEGARRSDIPGRFLAIALAGLVVGVLVLQPDFGQTLLVGAVWGALFFLAGLRMFWMASLGGAGVIGLILSYNYVHHVQQRINRFLNPESGDTFQVDRAMESFMQGGWFGKGPGEGTVKRILPDSHTDFIFAVTGEEFGIVVCLAIVSLFAFVVLRGLYLAIHEEDMFKRLAIAGLSLLFGLQSIINMAVNVHLMPAKGMTLPFISYGGSSLISLALGMGMLLALTRHRPKSVALSGTSQLVPEPA
jgi:cell division protein FtsW